MELDEIAEHRADGVVEIVLNRPDRLNAISACPGGLRDQMLQALDAAERDEDVGAVLLRGEGRAFSVGGDLTGNAPRETEAEHREFLERADQFHQRLRESPLPIVAAVHGHCLGAALGLVAVVRLRPRGRARHLRVARRAHGAGRRHTPGPDRRSAVGEVPDPHR